MTAFADILACAIFFMRYRGCCSASLSSQSSPEMWLDGGRANRRRSSRLFELSSHGSTKPDNIHWLFKHYSLIRVCHQSAQSLLWAQTEERGTPFFLTLFLKKLPSHQVYPGWEPAASIYIWKSTAAPVDWGKLSVFEQWTKLPWWSLILCFIWRTAGEQRRGADWAV